MYAKAGNILLSLLGPAYFGFMHSPYVILRFAEFAAPPTNIAFIAFVRLYECAWHINDARRAPVE